jgi:hypothetical protein
MQRLILILEFNNFSLQLNPFIKTGNLVEFSDEKIMEDNIKNTFIKIKAEKQS